jgi:hypothetical protein
LERSALKPSSASAPPTDVADGADSLCELIGEVTDDDSTPRAGKLHLAIRLLESWTRLLEAEGADGLVDSAENERYRKFVEGLLRLTRRDGSVVLTDGRTGREPTARMREVWRAAARLVEPRLQRALNGVLGGGRTSKRGDLPPASANSEKAGLAVLRPTWSSPRLAVEYDSPQLRLALDCNGSLLFEGTCNPQVTIDGTLLTPLERWEETCWVTDDDVDYLELQLSLSGDCRVQRHLVFAREDQFVFLADAVLSGSPGTVDYRLTMPLAEGVSTESAGHTRETALVREGRRRGMVLPLGLSEWRSERFRGDLCTDGGLLELRQSAGNAAGLFAPWFIDLAPRRFGRPVTWRQLTVAEDRQIQPDDAAVGYRVQIGNRQWIFYRSLAACGNRTLLGHNLVSEFLAARFSRQGVPETLIEIEAPADENE